MIGVFVTFSYGDDFDELAAARSTVTSAVMPTSRQKSLRNSAQPRRTQLPISRL